MGPSIGNEFTLCSSGGCCIGVSHGGGEGEVIVTFKSGAILVYNIHDFSMVCSWQLSSSEQLLCAAITQPSSGTYWAIASHQGLLEWSREDDAITPSSSAMESDPVKLLVSETNKNPLIVYSNGTVGCVGGTSSLLSPKKGRKWVLRLAEVSCGCTVCVVGTHENVTIGIADIQAETVGIPCLTSIKSRGEQLVSSSICADKLLLLFSEGELLIVTLEPPLHPILSASTIPPPFATHLLALSSDYFILANADFLQLWDVHYHTCLHTVHVLISAGAKACCVENTVYVWSSEEGGPVRGWRVQVEKSKLALSLGKSSSAKSKSTILPFWPLSNKDIEAGESADSASIHLHTLCDKAQTPSLDMFMAVFNSQPLTPNHCYVDVIERLLSEDEFWGSEALSALLKAGLVPSNVDVLSEASARGDWSLAASCLTHGPPPQEKTIVSTLQKVLSFPEVLQCVVGEELVPKKLLLYKLLCQPFNDVLMQAPLAAVPFPIIKGLLSFLSEYVGVTSLLTPPSDHSPISYNMILEWVAFILDVHFTRLTLDHESRQLLLSLQSRVLAQVTCYNRISCLSSLEKVHSNWKNHNSDRWLYRVESWHYEM